MTRGIEVKRFGPSEFSGVVAVHVCRNLPDNRIGVVIG